jgi:hypothetical protein
MDSETQVPLDKLTRVYLKMRTAIQEVQQEYDAKLAALKEQQDAVKVAIKERMLALGTTSARTDFGTVILSKKTRYSTNDWASFKEFVVTNDALDLLEKRIAQKNMETFLTENPGLVPPGLNSDSEFDISVRKPSR